MPESTTATPPASKAPLDDVMLAMDVVDTLRHRSALVERELSAELREKQLIQRLREVYAAQGIEVPDHILAEGVAALAEDRFRYTPPPPGFSVTLAKIYIYRRRWLAPLFLALTLIAGLWLGYVFLVSAPRERRLRELPRQVAAEQASIDQLAQVPAAKDEAQQYAAAAERSLAGGDTAAAQRALGELQDLRARLEQEYELRIVLEGSTGVWRIPDVNEAARNYYIIVQAITPDGVVLSQPITSEEDGQTRSVTKWGLRVDEAIFQQIAADKQDDGIIQNNRFGAKKRGFLEPEYQIPTTGGAITSW
jgi:hypothetical protein